MKPVQPDPVLGAVVGSKPASRGQLKKQLSTSHQEKAKTVALQILDDRRGADYYRNVTILSGFLESSLALTKEKAARMAIAIQKDRNGANYYADPGILGQLLET